MELEEKIYSKQSSSVWNGDDQGDSVRLGEELNYSRLTHCETGPFIEYIPIPTEYQQSPCFQVLHRERKWKKFNRGQIS